MDTSHSRPNVAGSTREGFRALFEVVPALTDELRDQAFRIRHSVYCEDLGFEAVRTDGRETDEYDSHATAVLLRYLPTGEFIGCARLVQPNPQRLDEPLPFERICPPHLLRADVMHAHAVPRDRIAEVSRLAVISKFRRRKGEAQSAEPVGESDEGSGPARRFPHILLGLYLGTLALGEVKQVQRLYFLTEARLAAHLLKVGFTVSQVSEPVEHRGLRILSMANVPELVPGLNRHLKEIYDIVRYQVLGAYERDGNRSSAQGAVSQP